MHRSKLLFTEISFTKSNVSNSGWHTYCGNYLSCNLASESFERCTYSKANCTISSAKQINSLFQLNYTIDYTSYSSSKEIVLLNLKMDAKTVYVDTVFYRLPVLKWQPDCIHRCINQIWLMPIQYKNIGRKWFSSTTECLHYGC